MTELQLYEIIIDPCTAHHTLFVAKQFFLFFIGFSFFVFFSLSILRVSARESTTVLFTISSTKNDVHHEHNCTCNNALVLTAEQHHQPVFILYWHEAAAMATALAVTVI
jgi:hypothetical protein